MPASMTEPFLPLHPPGTQPVEHDPRAAFAREIDDVSRRLDAALGELYPPLSNLARAHVRDAHPLVRGAVILAAGIPDSLPSPDAHALLREQRVLLATALEMLAVALSIHKLLLVAAPDGSLDKALVGSTILTGDYCFSRAAALAAQTDSPQVVDCFAQALKNVSEGHLRRLFADGGSAGRDAAAAPAEDAELMTAGVRAVASLAGLSPDALQVALALAEQVALGSTAAAWTEQNPPAALTHAQAARWQAALAWLADVRQPAPPQR